MGSLLLSASGVVLGFGQTHAETVQVAVASNFVSIASKLGQEFETKTGHKIALATGSTGKLYAQILNGAPFDIYMSADSLRPELLETQGKSVEGSRYTYAIGRLVLWSRRNFEDAQSLHSVLTHPLVKKIAIPNPELAPFGLAAQQTLEHLSLADQVKDKLVYAENVGQSFSFAATYNADIAFVSFSNSLSWPSNETGLTLLISEEFHAPIRQDAVLLLNSEQNKAAVAFMDFLQSKEARQLISQSGYNLAVK